VTTAVVAVVAVVATHPGVTSVAGLTPRGERLFQIETVSPTGAMLVTSYEALTATNSAVPLAADAGVSTVFVPAPLAWVLSDRRAESDTTAVYDTGGGEILREPGVSELKRAGTKTPSLQTIAIDHGPAGLQADLGRIGPDTQSGGRLVGKVTNRGSRPLYRLRAQLSAPNQGDQALLAEVLAPGATVDVDAPLKAPARWCFLPDCPRVGSSARGRAENATMFAAAEQAVGRWEQVGLVALVDSPSATPRPDGLSPPVRVVVQAASLREPYGPQFYGRRVALVVANSASVATYEVRVPRNPTGLLSLTSELNPDDQPPTDLFDWESHAWHRLGIDRALRPSEYSNGIVRARVQSPAPPLQMMVHNSAAPG